MKEVLSLNELKKSEILEILDVASDIEKTPRPKELDGKIQASLFFEPSTRTKSSFTGAMYRLGGKVINFDAGGNNSMKKGETVSDTMTILSLYCDIAVVRSPYEGTAKRASEILDIPVINAGDGSNEHPSQTLLDLYTIRKEKGKLNNIKIAFVGDLKYGRTVHSLSKALNKFENNTIYYIAPDEMQVPTHITDELKNTIFHKQEDFKSIVKDIDIFYMTRIQEERFEDKALYRKCAKIYRIDKELLKICDKDMKIMHPLPRIDEMDRNLDDSPNAIYFDQAKNGLYIREAIISLLLQNCEKIQYKASDKKCKNPNCISTLENLDGKASLYTENNKEVCFYCSKPL